MSLNSFLLSSLPLRLVFFFFCFVLFYASVWSDEPTTLLENKWDAQQSKKTSGGSKSSPGRMSACYLLSPWMMSLGVCCFVALPARLGHFVLSRRVREVGLHPAPCRFVQACLQLLLSTPTGNTHTLGHRKRGKKILSSAIAINKAAYYILLLFELYKPGIVFNPLYNNELLVLACSIKLKSGVINQNI